MAIRASAGQTVLTVRSQPDAPIPLIFSDFTTSSNFSFCIAAKALSRINSGTIIAYIGTNGDSVDITMDGVHWALRYYRNSILMQNQVIQPVIDGVWNIFYFRHVGTGGGATFDLYRGREDNTIDPNWHPGDPISMSFNNNNYGPLDSASDFIFDRIEITASHNIAVCNVKVWNSIMTDISDITQAVNRWDSVDGPPLSVPVWNSPIRTPGDLSNTAYNVVYSSFDWDLGHSYFSILPNVGNIVMDLPDPGYMAANTFCSVWIYPFETYDKIRTITMNPGLTPLVPTIYKSTDLIKFEDRGAIPPITSSISVIQCAVPWDDQTGQPASVSLPLYYNEAGIEQTFNTNNPAYDFPFLGYINVPVAIDSISIYVWKFGGQFRWDSQPTQVKTATEYLGYMFFYITYIGFPTGVPAPPPDSLVGLFVLDKGGKSVDKYNFDTELKIPNPTIRTALIGE